MEQQMGGWNKVISIACTERQLVKADGHPLYLRLGTIKTGAYHPTSGTSLLNVALAEGCREGELAIVEGIIEIEIQCLLRDFSLMDIYLAGSHFLVTMEGLGREIDYVEAIAVAIGIEIELKVLILASQLGWVHSQAKSQSPISYTMERVPRQSAITLVWVSVPSVFAVVSKSAPERLPLSLMVHRA